MAVADSTFVELVELHIHAESAEFVTNSTSSRSEDRHEISDDLEFNNVIEDRREYGMTSSVL